MGVNVLCGDARSVMDGLPELSVHCVITSPPYFGLRSYNGGPKEIGTEQTPREYVAALVDVFRAVHRVLRDDGTLWVVLGDTYAHDRTSQVVDNKHRDVGNNESMRVPDGLKAKSLLGIPWRVAFALQDAGWILRQEMVWSKPSCMPESVKDRCTRSHETVFMLAKQARYSYDADAIREPHADAQDRPRRRATENHGGKLGRWGGDTRGGVIPSHPHAAGRNKRSVWTIPTSPFSSKKYGCDTEHYAAFPPDLVRPMVRAATSERGVCPQCGSPWRRVVERYRTHNGERVEDLGSWRGSDRSSPQTAQGDGHWRYGTVSKHNGWDAGCSCEANEPVPAMVLDPFCGSGTTGFVAAQEGRHFIGCDINPQYVALAQARIATAQPPLFAACASGDNRSA